jgi:hypothetical protein
MACGYLDRTSIATDIQTLADILSLSVDRVGEPLVAAEEAIERFRRSREAPVRSQLAALRKMAELADPLQTALRLIGPRSKRRLQSEYKNWLACHPSQLARLADDERSGAAWARRAEEQELTDLGATAEEIAENRHHARADALLQDDLRAVARLSKNLSTAIKRENKRAATKSGAPRKDLADHAVLRLREAYEDITGSKFINSHHRSSKGRARRFVIKAFDLWDIGDPSVADGALKRAERKQAKTSKYPPQTRG